MAMDPRKIYAERGDMMLSYLMGFEDPDTAFQIWTTLMENDHHISYRDSVERVAMEYHRRKR